MLSCTDEIQQIETGVREVKSYVDMTNWVKQASEEDLRSLERLIAQELGDRAFDAVIEADEAIADIEKFLE